MHASYSLITNYLVRAPRLPCQNLQQPLAISAMAAPSAHTSNYKRTRSMPPEKVEVFKSLEGWATKHVLPLLKPVEQCWQPQDFLPDSSKQLDEFYEQVRELRNRTAELPDEYLVVLVGDMITEDALPTYQSYINNLDGVKDETGASLTPWAIWNRGWSAEENRHGDLLRTYLYLSGRVDMHTIEKTVQYLIGSGMDPGTENNPYLGFVYTSFQERATFISHGNTARLAKKSGDPVLARICGTIAADEKRHENAYAQIIGKILEVDPSCAVLAIADMMRKKITMPAYLMYDGHDTNLFNHFSILAQELGVYTTNDYADILDYFVRFWGLEKLEGLTDEARRAQDFVCRLAPRIRMMQKHANKHTYKKKSQLVRFSWIFNKELEVEEMKLGFFHEK